MELLLICDEEKLFEGEISELIVKTESGPVTILPGHEPYMTKISGEVKYVADHDIQGSIEISEGFVYTNGVRCFVVVDK